MLGNRPPRWKPRGKLPPIAKEDEIFKHMASDDELETPEEVVADETENRILSEGILIFIVCVYVRNVVI